MDKNLPIAPEAIGNYVTYKKIGNYVYTSGHVPITENYGPRHGDSIMDGWLKQFRNLLKMRPYINFTIVHDNPPEYMYHLQTGTDLGNSKVISYAEFEKVLTPSQA